MPKSTNVPLSSRKHGELCAIVDEDDLPLVTPYRWYPHQCANRIYAKARIKVDGRWRMVLLHRHILGLSKGDPAVDHENGFGLDCRRSNLRTATQQQNLWNKGKPKTSGATSPYKGVSKQRGAASYKVQIATANGRIYVGSFRDQIDAARAYDAAARLYHGEFAKLNFPGGFVAKHPDGPKKKDQDVAY